MGDRAVDCARLESVCAERHRGFESPPIRFPRMTFTGEILALYFSLGRLRVKPKHNSNYHGGLFNTFPFRSRFGS
jgi:hypothetical protein